MITRRSFLVSSLLASAIAPARAQSYPSTLGRLIVPFPPGGGTDVLGGLVSTAVENVGGQTVVLENRPGAAGLIGTKQVESSPADGYTLLMASTGAILALAGSQSGSFDVTKELAPISLVSAPPY